MNCVLHIISDFDFTIKMFENEKEIFSISSEEALGDEINLSLSSYEKFSVYVYPHETKKFLPYSLNFTNENTLSCKSNYATLFSLPEKNYVLKLSKISIYNNNFVGNKIELDSNNLKQLTYLYDIVGRAKVENFSLNKNTFVEKEHFFVYTNKEKQNVFNDLLLLDFFQAIFANDFSYAKKLLSTELSNKLTNETFKDFFGNFTFCKLVNYYNTPAVAIFYENTARVFASNLFEDKITDIYEIN